MIVGNIINLVVEKKCSHGRYVMSSKGIVCGNCASIVEADFAIRDLWFGLNRRILDIKLINNALMQYVNPELKDYRVKQVAALENDILQKNS